MAEEMEEPQIKHIAPADLSEGLLGKPLLDLNNASAQELSWLAPEGLTHLVAQAFLACRIGDADAFLLAFDQSARYDSPNFLWFQSRYERFVYVDRIVVAKPMRGRGYARYLYQDLFERASQVGHERVVCEINAVPPNPASDAFHRALGFHQVGMAAVHHGTKTVRYFSYDLSAQLTLK